MYRTLTHQVLHALILYIPSVSQVTLVSRMNDYQTLALRLSHFQVQAILYSTVANPVVTGLPPKNGIAHSKFELFYTRICDHAFGGSPITTGRFGRQGSIDYDLILH